MEKLVIYGSGGMAREVAQWVEDINTARPTWEIAGFVDDFRGDYGEEVNGYPVLGTGEILGKPGVPRNVIIAVGDPGAREGIYSRIRETGLIFPVLVHPTARVARTAQLGEGVIVGIDCIVSVNTVIGKHVFLNMQTVVGHDAVIGDFSSCLVNCVVAGNVNIHEGVLLGSGCIIKEKTTIGRGAKVSMGSVVSFDVEPGHVVMTRPSRSMFFG